jgi:PAS domain S-box-containing protein
MRLKKMKSQKSKGSHGVLYDDLLDGVAHCQMIFDAEGNPVDFIFLSANKVFKIVTGWDGVHKMNISNLIPGVGASNPELFEMCGLVSLTQKPKRFEVYFKQLGRWFLITAYSSKLKFFTAFFEDITDRKQVENDLEDARIAARNVLEDLQVEKERLTDAKARDDALLASLGEGVIAVDNDKKIMFLNAVAAEMLDWKMKDLIGTVLTDLPLEDEAGDPVPLDKRPTTIALATGEPTKVSYIFVRKDKTKFPIAITATPIKLYGKTIGLIEMIRDVTREKELDRVKSEFISVASHQLRTPLTGIQWVLERFTKKEKLTPKGKEYLDDLHTSAKRLTELVDILLNLSRIESGRVGITPEPVEVIGFTKSFLDETVPLQDKKGVKVVFEDHPAELPVMTDKIALRNVIQSLVSNAIEYTVAGGRVNVAIQKKRDAFTITVQDTGIGIPRAEQAYIFEKFVRASNAKLYKTDGTGLGLFIAERSVSRLGGKIWFESRENKGSTFHVELPLQAREKKVNKQPVA